MGKASGRKKFRKQIVAEAFAYMCGDNCIYLNEGGCRLASHPNECAWGVINQSLTKDWQRRLMRYEVNNV